MNNLPNFQHATFESVWASIQENERYLREMFAETDRILTEKFAETDRLFKEQASERERERKEAERLFKEQASERDRERKEVERERKEAERERKKSEAEFEKSRKDFDRRMKKLEEITGGMGNSNGEMAEEYFFNAFRRNKTFVNETFDKVLRNKCINNGKWEAEFDILLLNGKSAAIIEVKYRAKPDNIVIEKLISRIEPFKVLFPEYKNHHIYLGVAAMSFDKRLAIRLHKAGIATIHQEGKRMVVYDKELKAF
jgi:hypothetical protein